MVLKSSHFRPVDRFRTLLGRYLAVVPVSANGWTLASLLPALVGLFALTREMLLIGLVLFAIAGLLDAIDGAVARERGEMTPFGAYLDGMIDRFVEAALLVGLMVYAYPDWILPGWLWLVLLLFFGTAMTSFARAYADHRGVVTSPGDLDDMGGILERAERLLLVFASMVAWFVDPLAATAIIALATMLALVTVLQRMAYVRTVSNRPASVPTSQP